MAHPVGPNSQGKRFFSQNTGGPSGGSLLSDGGIIIFRVIRRHFLAAAVDPAVSLSPRSVPASKGSIHFFVRNKEALPVGPS